MKSSIRIHKSAILLLCIAVATAVQALDFQTIRKNKEQMTDLQWKQYQQQLIGQMVYWSGWVDEVSLSGSGQCKVLVDMDPPDALSVFDVTLFASESAAINLSKDQRVNISGKIKSISSFFGLNITLINSTIQ